MEKQGYRKGAVSQGKKFIVAADQPFLAAGRYYEKTQDLEIARMKDDPTWSWSMDRYGRKVFKVKERFPCFDSYDSFCEDGYSLWFYICRNGVLTRIYIGDGWKSSVEVTEDVAFLDKRSWREMEKAHYLECR